MKQYAVIWLGVLAAKTCRVCRSQIESENLSYRPRSPFAFSSKLLSLTFLSLKSTTEEHTATYLSFSISGLLNAQLTRPSKVDTGLEHRSWEVQLSLSQLPTTVLTATQVDISRLKATTQQRQTAPGPKGPRVDVYHLQEDCFAPALILLDAFRYDVSVRFDMTNNVLTGLQTDFVIFRRVLRIAY